MNKWQIEIMVSMHVILRVMDVKSCECCNDVFFYFALYEPIIIVLCVAHLLSSVCHSLRPPWRFMGGNTGACPGGPHFLSD